MKNAFGDRGYATCTLVRACKSQFLFLFLFWIVYNVLSEDCIILLSGVSEVPFLTNWTADLP